MVAIDRRLDLLTSELTAHERAVLCLRAWCKGEDVDERLTRYCPPQDKGEMKRIWDAVLQGNSQLHSAMIIHLEWTALIESEIEWYKILVLYQDRVAALERVAKKEVAPLPSPWKLERKVPIGWGRIVHGDDPGPKDWGSFLSLVRRNIERSLRRRWQEVVSCDGALDELAEALGERVVHVDLDKCLEGLRASVIRLWGDFGMEEEMPGPEPEQVQFYRDHFDWEAIRTVPKEKQAREWMHPQQQADLEEFEREQAATLREAR